MPHIQLPEGLPGIVGRLAFRPETAKPLNELAEIPLRGPSTLSGGSGVRRQLRFVAKRLFLLTQNLWRARAYHLDGDDGAHVSA
jgi:hypothetical protein